MLFFFGYFDKLAFTLTVITKWQMSNQQLSAKMEPGKKETENGLIRKNANQRLRETVVTSTAIPKIT